MPPVEDGKARVVMKITGALVDLLVDIAPEIYGPHVVYENGHKVLYVQVVRTLYGMLVAALLWYKKFRADLESIGFTFNPYDPCVANRITNDKQHMVRFHVDDLMSSHQEYEVNTQFLHWLNKLYGGHGEVKATRGLKHAPFRRWAAPAACRSHWRGQQDKPPPLATAMSLSRRSGRARPSSPSEPRWQLRRAPPTRGLKAAFAGQS